MTLTAKHRSSLFQSLAPIVGEDEAEALLSHFPSREADEPINKDFLRAEMSDLRQELRDEMSDLRQELKGEMSDLRQELRSEMGDLRQEVKADIGGVRAEIAHLEARMNDKFRQMAIWVTTVNATLVGIVAVLG